MTQGGTEVIHPAISRLWVLPAHPFPVSDRVAPARMLVHVVPGATYISAYATMYMYICKSRAEVDLWAVLQRLSIVVVIDIPTLHDRLFALLLFPSLAAHPPRPLGMSAPGSSSQAPKVAIKFGAPSSSHKSGHRPSKTGPARPPSSLGKRQRNNALNPDSESEEEDESRREVVTSFGANGAKGVDVLLKGFQELTSPTIGRCMLHTQFTTSLLL
jgi:hypothetical protein